MDSQVDSTIKNIRSLRRQLHQGKVFRGLPNDLHELIKNVSVDAATAVALPEDDTEALAKIAAIELRLKAEKKMQVTDSDLRYLIAHLASTNPEVRDKGVFFLLSDLFQADAFTEKQVTWLFTTLQRKDILFAHITEPQNDAVFLRSFAVMLLSGLVYADLNRYHLLTPRQFENLLVNLCAYIVLERDGRGYVAGKGWAHAYTHIGNLADELSQVPSLMRGDKLLLMAAVLEGWQRSEDSLVFGEDQRVSAYLVNIATKNQFYADALVMCLTAWQTRLRNLKPQENLGFWTRWYNRSRLLEALLMRADLPKVVVDYLQKIIDAY
ncbi:DUF2785 domain-containing protein [Lacticaseibacillus camelliae]|uniref:DUF2785 domain-containing protein n=1 Tax=Lacticaseibacillus camelliae DSM 22697 = JCM 13995 TaxID=1423730 RepID=A0A0R2FK08_9LACO|nr:DUF2785 domain-containing protein [Lacticaseibacillus camelliae]KRN25082.1 hypothetical protein FC75_GL000995 [Lacticaseibacillus camelliae DSM 22697 = JCM 13995]